MGCGGSTLNANQESVTSKIRPAIHRRIEEIRKRTRAAQIQESASSKKVLLPKKSKADDHDHESEASLNKQEPENSIKKHEKEADEKVVKFIAVPADDNKKAEQKNDETDCHKQGDEEEDLGREDNITYPGSPSFRVYYIDNLHVTDDDNADHDGIGDGAKSGQQKCEATINTPSPNESTSVKEETVEKESGEKKRGGLMMVMQRGGQSSFKNLFNIRSCYTPSSYNRAQPLTGKPTA